MRRSALMPALAALLLLPACGHRDCAALDAGPARDACYAEEAVRLFREDPAAATAAIERDVGDPATRDLIWFEVTRAVEPGSVRYCQKISAPVLEERCRVFVSRPHLHPGREGTAPEGGGTPARPPGG
jgi:hypothetical protein